jgi:signal peptidase I
MNETQGKKYLETTGLSMWPFLRQQDRIVVEDAGYSELHPGDLVVYHSEGSQVCHRLVKKSISEGRSMLFTRGDYVPSWSTEKVDQAQVIGRVSAIVRDVRIISASGIRGRIIGRLVIIIFPIFAWTVSTIERIARKK